MIDRHYCDENVPANPNSLAGALCGGRAALAEHDGLSVRKHLNGGLVSCNNGCKARLEIAASPAHKPFGRKRLQGGIIVGMKADAH
jgi:hypothetical protein